MQYRFTARKKDNGWQLLLRYKDSSGKWKQKTKQGYSKKSDALVEEEKDKLLKLVINMGPVTEYPDMTLKELYAIFKQNKKQELTYNTLKNYERTLARLSSIADRKITDITTLDLIHACTSV